MSSLLQAPPPGVTRDEVKARAIVAEYLAERATFTIHTSGNKMHGCNIRYRNRLVREAGYTYNDAWAACHEAGWAALSEAVRS